MLPIIAGDEELTRQVLLMKDIEEQHIQVVSDAELKEINEKGVQLVYLTRSINLYYC